ncbi:hypothetical protein CYJ22_06250 [Schaalia odontolytica]|uniref:Uncharacterized protein n=1 Tax=Schaalia odontolytica TaxID=1660 RepID=A0A2I1HZV7_9ACTO|nr:hypothetical protein CYJ22_06250 [Schaalia odontolytica]
MLRISGGSRGVAADDAVAIRGAVDARVEQVGVHEVLRVSDRVRARTQLAVRQLLLGDGSRGDHAVTSSSRIGLTPPRLIEAARVALTVTASLTTKTILRRITAASISASVGFPVRRCGAAMIARIGIRCNCGDVDVFPLAHVRHCS